MFKIGEFSKIAQVSGRLLRYYDEIGLFKPQQVDRWTDYRYYTADQLPRLNRILALKELGLSLEQIQQMLDKEVSSDEIRQLYLERKAQLEQSLREQMARLQQVELRLNQLERQEDAWMPDVVVKRVPAQPMLAYRHTKMSVEELYRLFELLSQKLLDPSNEKSKYGSIVTVLYADLFLPEGEMDMAIGVLLNHTRSRSLKLSADVTLTVSELPAVEQMATVVHRGLDDHPLTYNALGRWLEAQNYHIVGAGRELVLGSYDPTKPETCVMEIQFPVEQIAVMVKL